MNHKKIKKPLFKFAKILFALLAFSMTLPLFAEYVYIDENGNQRWGHLDPSEPPGPGSSNQEGENPVINPPGDPGGQDGGGDDIPKEESDDDPGDDDPNDENPNDDDPEDGGTDDGPGDDGSDGDEMGGDPGGNNTNDEDEGSDDDSDEDDEDYGSDSGAVISDLIFDGSYDSHDTDTNDSGQVENEISSPEVLDNTLNESADLLEDQLKKEKDDNEMEELPPDTEDRLLEITGLVEKKEEALSLLQTKSQEDEKANRQTVKKQKDLEEEKTDGDPVKLASGIYEQKESDILLGNDLAVEIQRRYESGNKIISSFGKGWFTNLDQRIIFGTRVEDEEIDSKYKDYLESLPSSISQLEELIKSSYQTSSVEEAYDALLLKKSRCEQILANVQGLRLSISELEDKAQGSEVLARVSDLKKQGQELEQEIEGKLLALEKEFDQLQKKLSLLKTLKDTCEASLQEKETVQNSLALSLKRRINNEKVLFPGMDSFYQETGLNTINIINEKGYPVLMYETEEKSNVWKTDEKSDYIECLKNDEGYLLKEKNGFQKLFNPAGFLVQVTDRNFNSLFIEREESGKIKNIKSSSGEDFAFMYEGNFISRIKNERSKEEEVIYSYRGNLLHSVTDTDGDRIIFEYDENDYLICLKKSDDSFITFSYDLVTKEGQKLATATTNEEGHAEFFDYKDKMTTYTDHDGNKTFYKYDDRHRIVSEEKEDGSKIINTYDEQGNLASVSRNGNKVLYSYDAEGNKIQAIYEDTSSEAWSYDKFGQQLSYKDRDGVIHEYLRDERGNIIEYRLGQESVFRQTVNSKGQVINRTLYGQKNIFTEYKYDDFGNLIEELCDGVKTEYEYDKRNRLISLSINEKKIAEYEYRGSDIIEKSYNGLETTYVSNSRKDLTQVIQKDRITNVLHKIRIEYDGRHLPVKIFAGDEKSDDEKLMASYFYTPEGKISGQILHGKENWITLYEYFQGQIRLLKQFKTSKLEGFESAAALESLTPVTGEGKELEIYTQTFDCVIKDGGNSLLKVTDGLGFYSLFEYDPYGNLVESTDANGIKRNRVYTKAGRLKMEESAYGGWYLYDYKDGRLNSSGEKASAPVKTEYYNDGTIKSTCDKYDNLSFYDYDNRGHLVSIQGNNQKIWYEYDDFDRITKEALGDSPSEALALYYVTYEYSQDGRSVLITEGGKYQTQIILDAFGNPIKQIDGNGNTRRFEYDCLNQLTAAYDGYGNKTSYEYNAIGAIEKLLLPGGEQREYSYNCLGLLEKVTDDCGILYTASYDKAGRLIKERSRADSEKTYEYDKAGRLKKIISAGQVIESYEYENNIKRVIVTDGNGEKYFYNYDDFGRLVNEINRKGLSQYYYYDQGGQLAGQTNFDDSSTSVLYSEDRSECRVVYSDQSQNYFFYDMKGNVVQAQNVYGESLYSYDQGGRMIYQKDVTTGEEVFFEYDGAGNRIRLYSSNRDTRYIYGKNNEVKEIFDNKQRLRVQLDYNKNGSEVLRKFGNGTAETTLYDKAGRVIIKAQKSERGELLWAQAYLYGQDGKQSAKVDNTGRVTLYEYNKKGQLKTVCYPYSQEMINKVKAEAEENGLAAIIDPGENFFLPSEIRASLSSLMDSMQYGLSRNLTSLQIFIKESYSYDGKGNRISKTTKYGTIDYSYDKENCLLSSGSKGQPFVNYTYDKMGNLLSQESASKSVRYEYNAQNRLIYFSLIDKAEKTYVQTSYAYDAFGRRVLVQDKNQAALRTLYDGLTFDVIKQSPTFAGGLFTDTNEKGIRWTGLTQATGERYRYISQEEAGDGNRYFYLDEEIFKSPENRYLRERSQLIVNGSLAAQTSDEGIQYFSTDLLGSITCLTDTYGYQLASYSYDAFGSLVQGELTGTRDFGYLGKQQDPSSRLYNYGYRDYNPDSARFTTVDPIRDGTNWFAYVNNDPVNFVDLWGLCVVSDNKNTRPSGIDYDSLMKLRAPLNGSATEFANRMKSLVGTDYVYGGNSPEDGGMDCSGSIIYELKQMGNDIPDMQAKNIYVMTDPVVGQPLKGDLRFLKDEDGKIVHVQTIIDSDGTRVNATGDKTNTRDNPGKILLLDGPLPSSGEVRRLNFKQ